jgi:hypothetical protein
MFRLAKVKPVASLLLGVLFLTGCASQGSAPIPNGVEDGSTNTQNSESTKELTADDFYEIADTSCDLVLSEGVVESSIDGKYSQFAIPKSEAIEGYSAGYLVHESGEVGLVWSMEYFETCTPAILLDPAGDFYSGQSPEVTYLGDGNFEVVFESGQGKTSVNYQTQNGLIVSILFTDYENSGLDIEYGPVPEKYLAALRQAIDEFNQG